MLEERHGMSEDNRPKVLCMVDLNTAPEAVELLRREVDLDYVPADREVLLDTIGEYDALWGHISMKIDREVLDRATRLKAINTASTGTDHIDLGLAADRGIRVLSIKSDFALLDTFTATAELGWLLLLACHRHLRTALAAACEEKWPAGTLVGRQLSRTTLGVLGVGRLGKMTVEYGKAFRMRVLGCDLEPFDAPGVEPVNFDRLLRESDAIAIHVHMTKDNYHLFDAETFGKMKEGAILVNTSRGDIVDEAALIEALETGRLAAYGTDVVHDEWRDDMRTSALVRYARDHLSVIITPHMGGATHRSIADARTFSARKLVHFLKTGEELTMA
jgi:D-3-phosphoglycerate dehydrogenase